MKILFALLSALFVLAGLLFFGGAKSAVHEILAGVMFVVAALLAVGAALLSAVHQARREVTAHLEELTRRVPAPESNPTWLRSADKPGA